jgi:hypothetical protein
VGASSFIFRQGGPIAWTAVRQERTSLSSREAEIRATNEVSKLLMGIRHLADAVREGGNDIADTAAASPLYNYNDNESCVKWSHNMTTKQISHMEMRENAVREWVQDSLLKVLHVPGRILLIFSRRRCVMGPIFYAFVILSCVLCLSFFSSLSWTFISRASRMFLDHSHSSSCLRPLLRLHLTPGDPISWL